MCGRNYAELLEAGVLSLPLSFSPSRFALSDVSFNKRIKQDSTATLREAVNHSKPEATNNARRSRTGPPSYDPNRYQTYILPWSGDKEYGAVRILPYARTHIKTRE